MCNTNRDLQVNLHKVLAGICQSVVSIFWSSTGAATIIINSPRQSPMFLMVTARCHQVFTKVSFLPVYNFFCSTDNSLQLIVAISAGFFYYKKVLQPLPVFVMIYSPAHSKFQSHFKGVHKMNEGFVASLWRLYNCDLCNPTQKPGLWSSFWMGELIYHITTGNLHDMMRGVIHCCIKWSLQAYAHCTIICQDVDIW